MRSWMTHSWIRLIAISSISMLLGLAVVGSLATFWLQVPPSDGASLVSLLASTGIASVLIGSLGMLWLRHGHVRIWVQVTLTYLFGVAVALWNIFVTARLMFISEHDLPLLMLLLLFAACVAIGLGIALSQAVVQRVANLHEGARAIADGDVTVRVPVTGDDELASLGRTFNHMAAQLADAARERQHQERTRKELISAISHDLRTPLASLRAMTEALVDGVVTDEVTTARYYTSMRTQIGHMNKLIDDLFSLSQLEEGAVSLDLQPLDPAVLIHDMLAAHSPQAQQQGVKLQAEVAPQCGAIYASPQHLMRVLDNLLTNALRYTPSGGSITVRVAAQSQQSVRIEVVDSGQGIAAEDLPHVFERFYRGEKSRSREHGGAGLGLAIARGIVQAHGGTMEVQSEPGRGTIIGLELAKV